ncbi:DUF5011 domain-containing protein [Bacillus sp. N3536]|nr:DUF5011 domain-containing protein [Bacillus sp. N3536]
MKKAKKTMSKMIVVATSAALIASYSGSAVNVLAASSTDAIKTAVELEVKEAKEATVSKFDLYENSYLNAYNEVFKVAREVITSVTTNGGNYSGSPVEYAIDGNLNTHWETGKPNSTTFTNELIFTFKDSTELNRIVYAARQSSAQGKGFAQEFEVYSSSTDTGDDFALVSPGEYKGTTGDIIEIEFDSTEFKRIKFVFKKANQDWASAAEFGFYKEDHVRASMKSLFTDSTFTKVSAEFSSVEALNNLDKEAQNHPLYEQYKEDIENARALITEEKIESTIATTKQFKYYSDNEYSKLFRMDYDNILSIRNNGGHYSSSVIGNAVDGNISTYWETNRANTTSFSNEVEVTFKEAITLDRIMYGARPDNKGFAEEFDIYASQTSTGDTYQVVANGQHNLVTGLVEAKFEPTNFKRIKFVFKKSNQNWATLSELAFYKEDVSSNKMAKLFTDSNKNRVAAEFNTVEKLKILEDSVKEHPLYDVEFKEDLTNAYVLINQEDVETTTAVTRAFGYYDNVAYTELFKMNNENIKSIRNNGGHYSSAVLANAIDGNISTYWETNRTNTASFSNEVELEFNELITLNRIVYGARSDRKGFAENFDIYASQTSKGDTYQLVSTGKHNVISGLVEAKFVPTQFKRVKFVFKKSNQNWATLSEIAFYKEDPIEDKINNIFTDDTMSELTSEYNEVAKINALENEAKAHPLYSILKYRLDLAKQLLKGEIVTDGRIIQVEQHGNMMSHANQNLKFGFGNNYQPTGIAALPGDKVTVYVEADSDGPLPQIVFAQQEGSFANWARTVNLQPGKNEITVPAVPQDSWYKQEVTKGGTIYIHNPYTPEQQQTSPIIRIEGGERIPFVTKDTNPEEFKAFLIDYKNRLDLDKQNHPNVEDRKLIDVVEVVSDHLVFTGTATGAYQTYSVNGYNPLDTVKSYNNYMDEIFKFYGLDGSNEKNDPKYIRENIRLAQPFGYMYAYTNHIGVQGDVMESMLVPDSYGWGISHEIGHRMDVNARLYGETTNNMIAMQMSVYYGKTDQRIPYEDDIYKTIFDDNPSPYEPQGYFKRLGVFWQLEMYHKDYWGELNKLYRERDISAATEDAKQQYLVELSSEVVGQDLSEHFARHGFTVNQETKEKVSKYPKPKKVWYLNNSVLGYEGVGFSKGASVDVNIVRDTEKKTNTIHFVMDKANKDDLLGYEISRNGKMIGFTSTASFVDQNISSNENYTYQIVAYDKKLNTSEPLEIKVFKPTLSVEDHLTLKLNQSFDPMSYVKASDYQGIDITEDVVVKSNNVNTTQKGNYEIVYEVINKDIKETKTTQVTVVSDFEYASDMNPVSSNIAWGGYKKDKSPSGGTIGLVRQGLEATYAKGIGAHAISEIVYNIDGKGFDFFESYIGIDQAMRGKGSSAAFEVWVDGEKKYISNNFNSNTDSEFIRVPLTEAKEIKLVTTDAGNNGSDHTVWADAKFTKNSSKPVITVKSEATKVGQPIDIKGQYSAVDAEDGDLTDRVEVTGVDKVNFNKTGKYEIKYTVTDNDNITVTEMRTISVVNMEDYKYLSDFDWKSTQNSYTAPKKDKAVSDNILRLTNESGSQVSYEKGIGAHSNSTIVYDLTNKDVDYFTSFVGVDRQMYGTVGSVIFQVFVDGEKRFESGLMNSRDAQKFVEVNLAGAKEIKLVVTDGGNGNGSDHATWGNAKLHFANSERIYMQDLMVIIETAKAINAEDYTKESMNALIASLAKAEEVLANTNATQTEVDEAVNALETAKAGLVEVILTQVITIKDDYLRESIKSTLGLKEEITLNDMRKLTSLTSESKRVRSLEGIEYAQNLETLDISGNEITDFSPLNELKNLKTLIADLQFVDVGELKGPLVEVENLVTGFDGKKVRPDVAGLNKTITNKEIQLDVNAWENNPERFTIDLSEEEKGLYWLGLSYKVGENTVILRYLINNK